MCTILVDYLQKEITAGYGKKKALDQNLGKTFKRFLQLAEDERRSGISAL